MFNATLHHRNFCDHNLYIRNVSLIKTEQNLWQRRCIERDSNYKSPTVNLRSGFYNVAPLFTKLVLKECAIRKRTLVYVNKPVGFRDVMVIVVANEYGETSSKPD